MAISKLSDLTDAQLRAMKDLASGKAFANLGLKQRGGRTVALQHLERWGWCTSRVATRGA